MAFNVAIHERQHAGIVIMAGRRVPECVRRQSADAPIEIEGK